MPNSPNRGMVHDHPTLALHHAVGAANRGGDLGRIVAALETYWELDLEPAGLAEALAKAGGLEFDDRSLHGFYLCVCRLNAIRPVRESYSDDELIALERRIDESVRAREELNAADAKGALQRAALAFAEVSFRREVTDAWFDRYERSRYHRFWPATQIEDILEPLFDPSSNPGRIIGQYFRAMFDEPFPEDPDLGLFIDKKSSQTRGIFLAMAQRVAERLVDSHQLPADDQMALRVLLSGDTFGIPGERSEDEEVSQTLALAVAAAGVNNQALFTALALEAVSCSYLEIDDDEPADAAAALCLLAALLIGTDRERGDEIGIGEAIRSVGADDRLSHPKLSAPMRSRIVDSWKVIKERIELLRMSVLAHPPRFPPQLLFRLLNWRNYCIAEIVNYKDRFSSAVVNRHLVGAARYSESSLHGRSYFLWKDAVDPAPILERALSASDTRHWSLATLLAFVQSNTFAESYAGQFKSEAEGLGEFEREFTRRAFGAGLDELGAALVGFFLVSHAFKHGTLPEAAKWDPLIRQGLRTARGKLVRTAIDYAAEQARSRGHELTALRLNSLAPGPERDDLPSDRRVGWSSLAGSNAADTIENIRGFLGGVDPTQVLDDESLGQWVSAHLTEAAVRSSFGARGLKSWISPGHGYHAALECTLRNRLVKVYKSPEYRAFKKGAGEDSHLKGTPSLDQLIYLLRDAGRSESVRRLLDGVTALHQDEAIISKLEKVNQKYRRRTGHGEPFDAVWMAEAHEILFGQDSLFRNVILKLLPAASGTDPFSNQQPPAHE